MRRGFEDELLGGRFQSRPDARVNVRGGGGESFHPRLGGDYRVFDIFLGVECCALQRVARVTQRRFKPFRLRAERVAFFKRQLRRFVPSFLRLHEL